MLGFDGLSILSLLHFVIAVPVCAHILLTKEQEAVAFGWIAVVLLSPFLGSALYGVFGVNRIARVARKVRGRRRSKVRHIAQHVAPLSHAPTDHERQIFQYARSVHDLPFVAGNTVELLVNGDEAYPVMLAAIERATATIALSVYIFDADAAGEKFVAALIAAKQRGVAVRVLIDDIGIRYSARAIDGDLDKAGVKTARFMPRSLTRLPYINLRNHRKLLLIDGKEGFIGGMNIRHGHMLQDNPSHPVQDIHFRVVGPVLDQMTAVFEQDWTFAAGEELALPLWNGEVTGGALARVAPDGPDGDNEKLQWILLGALAMARKSVRVITPYFLPNDVLASALMVAALRGVAVEVIIPAKSNLPLIGWAMQAKLPRLVEHAVNIYLCPPPFNHSKMVVVDGAWALVGSTNWDARSLRLNFEVNLECYDADVGAILEAYFAGKKAMASLVTLEDLRRMSLGARLRNSIIHLFSSYL